jgi:hypothetical protein
MPGPEVLFLLLDTLGLGLREASRRGSIMEASGQGSARSETIAKPCRATPPSSLFSNTAVTHPRSCRVGLPG